MLNLHDVRLLDFSLSGICLHADLVVALNRNLLPELVSLTESVVDDGFGLVVVAAPECRCIAVEEFLLVELGGVADTGNLVFELVDLNLNVASVLSGCRWPPGLRVRAYAGGLSGSPEARLLLSG